MGATAGYGLSITFTNFTGAIKSWSTEEAADMLEFTNSASGGTKEYMKGLTGWTATVSFDYDSANTFGVGDSATLTLQYTSGTTISGTALVASIGTTTEVAGIITCEATFQGTGTLP